MTAYICPFCIAGTITVVQTFRITKNNEKIERSVLKCLSDHWFVVDSSELDLLFSLFERKNFVL